jgi:DnaJ-domain-containing protein 1
MMKSWACRLQEANRTCIALASTCYVTALNLASSVLVNSSCTLLLHLQILDVDRQASERDIKRAYRDLAKKLHPDKVRAYIARAATTATISPVYLGDSNIMSGMQCS